MPTPLPSRISRPLCPYRAPILAVPAARRLDGELLSLSGEFAPLAPVERERERPRSGSWSDVDTDEPRVRDLPLLSLLLSDTERESKENKPEDEVVDPVVT